MTRVDVGSRSGVTLIEMLIGLTIMGMVTATALAFVRQQDVAFSMGSARMDALQNYRFAAEILERNIRTAGSHVAAGQPFLIYADSSTISINADYASSDPEDAFAVYVDPAATSAETGSLPRGRRIALPGTGFLYPDSTYRDGAVPSSAETITFFFAPDSSTDRTDDHALYRQVNDLEPETVARGLLHLDDEPFFQFQQLISGDTVIPRMEWVPESDLPLTHAVPMHLSVADTGTAARIDRVRAVRIAFRSVAGQGERELSSPLRRFIRMPNAGQTALRTCGEEPLFSSSVNAAQPAGEARVVVTWSPSFDETSGESDVIRYAIFRRVGSDPNWGEPYFSVPAGQPSYLYSDGTVVADSTYQYAIAAQDCTPSMSDVRVSPPVLVVP